eukprot:gene20376-22385_t
MAKSKYEYVKKFEEKDSCLPNCWIVVRIDGHNFHKFSSEHCYEKPNDKRALDLMNSCAVEVMKEFRDIEIAYGQSDEYSFIFKRKTTQFSRRKSKLITNIVSLFSSSFVFNWKNFFPDKDMIYPPSFDSRAVIYPSLENIKDYLKWRQADCHINNLYNTCFWNLVLHGGMTNKEAESRLKDTLSGEKNEILFSQFGINYNNESQQFRKGSVLYWNANSEVNVENKESNEKVCKSEEISKKKHVIISQCDIIGDEFWKQNPQLLQ